MDGEPCQLAVKGRKELPNKGWDVKAYMAAQKEKDNQIQLVLDMFRVEENMSAFIWII